MKKYVKYLIITLVVGIMIAIGTYAYWSYESSNKKNISIQTSRELSNYIIYDEGESKFAGELKVGSSYLDGVHTTISIKKTNDASNLELIATVNMTVNAIGDNIKNSYGLKWAITKGDSTSAGTLLNQGNFYGKNNDDVIELKTGIEVTTTEEKYTVWIWIDGSENIDPKIVGETLDTSVWTQVDQILDNRFEVTSINSNYQFINASAVNTTKNIVAYAVTNTSSQPSSYTNLTTQEQGNVYNVVDYKVTNTGTYYVWFKDSAGNTVNESVAVSKIDTTPPVCTFGNFEPSTIKNGETSVVELTCVDEEIGIKSSDITSSSITLNGSSATLNSNIEKTRITNGFKYKLTVTGTSTDGDTSLSLNAGVVNNKAGLSNSTPSSTPTVKVQNFTNVAIPIQSGTLTYNTASQTPSWTNYDSTLMTLSGTTSGTNAGTYSATFTLKDTTSYKWSDGTSTAKTISWKINQYNISNVDVGSISDQTYTGSAIAPVPVLSKILNGSSKYTLVKDTDYTLSYSNNTNAGTATITATGKGNFTGTASTTFTINKASLTVPSQSGTLTYNMTSRSPSWTNYDSTLMIISGTTSGKNAGTYSVTFELRNTTNYQWSDGTTTEKTVSWKISPRSITDFEFSLATYYYAYTGSAITPTVSSTGTLMNDEEYDACDSACTTQECYSDCVNAHRYSLILNTDYTLSYSNNTNVGTATVTITGKDNFTGTVSKTFTIYTWMNTSKSTYYSDFTSAVNGATAGDTIRLDASYTDSAAYVDVDGKNLTIDSNGKTLTFSDTVDASCSISIYDSTVTLTGTGTYSGQKCLVYISNSTVSILSGNFVTTGQYGSGVGSGVYLNSGTLNLSTAPSDLMSTSRRDIGSRNSPYIYSGSNASVYIGNGQFNMYGGYLQSDNTNSVATLFFHSSNTYHPVIDGGDILSDNYVAIQNDSTSAVLEITGSAHIGTPSVHSAINSSGVVRINGDYDGRVQVEGQRRPYCSSTTSCTSGREYGTIIYSGGYGIYNNNKAAISFGSQSSYNISSTLSTGNIENWAPTVITTNYPFANATKIYMFSGWLFHGTSTYYNTGTVNSGGRSITTATSTQTSHSITFGPGSNYSKSITISGISKNSYPYQTELTNAFGSEVTAVTRTSGTLYAWRSGSSCTSLNSCGTGSCNSIGVINSNWNIYVISHYSTNSNLYYAWVPITSNAWSDKYPGYHILAKDGHGSISTCAGLQTPITFSSYVTTTYNNRTYAKVIMPLKNGSTCYVSSCSDLPS